MVEDTESSWLLDTRAFWIFLWFFSPPQIQSPSEGLPLTEGEERATQLIKIDYLLPS